MKSFTLLLFGFILYSSTTFYGQQSFGILYNKDNYPVKIIHNNISKRIKSKTILLYRNDRIISKSLGKMVINLAPHAYGEKIGDSSIVIMVKNVSESGNLLTHLWESVSSYLGFVKEDFNRTSVVHQRGDYSLPDTLIATVKFIPVKINCADSRSFTLYDSDNKAIFSPDISGKNFIEILPNDLNMEYGKIYYWEIKYGEEKRTGKIIILNNELHNIITNNFLQIEKSVDDKSRQMIMKASYLQMLSDIYENTPDLYWLSNKILEKVNAAKYPEAKFIENRCSTHFIK